MGNILVRSRSFYEKSYDSPMRKPICLLAFSSGILNCRIASNTDLNLASYLFSSSSSLRANSLCVERIMRSLTNARITEMLTSMARSEWRTVESMATPCSVNTKGLYCVPPRLSFEVAFCDLKTLNSFLLSSNIKSGGKRFLFRRICSLSLRVGTPSND